VPANEFQLKSKLKRPTARQFFDPLIKVLGRELSYRAGIGVPHKAVLDGVLREVGIDPDNSPWPLRGTKKKLGLHRIIGFALRNQRADIDTSRYSGQREALCLCFGRGLWGLTEEGVEKSRRLSEVSFESFVPDLPENLLPPLPPPPRSSPEPEMLTPPPLPQEPEGDTRDDLTWVVMELTHRGESRVMDGTLETTLRRILDLEEDHPIFIPATCYRRGDRAVTLQLMEGYVFVGSGLAEVQYFKAEYDPCIHRVMSSNGYGEIRALSVLPNSSIEDMRRQLRNLAVLDVSPGEEVRVVEGKYAGLNMVVLLLDEDGENVVLQTIGLRSIQVITRLPLAFLARKEDETVPEERGDEIELGLYEV
jgi:transcription antitermination factor NusG